MVRKKQNKTKEIKGWDYRILKSTTHSTPFGDFPFVSPTGEGLASQTIFKSLLAGLTCDSTQTKSTSYEIKFDQYYQGSTSKI